LKSQTAETALVESPIEGTESVGNIVPTEMHLKTMEIFCGGAKRISRASLTGALLKMSEV